MLDGAFPTAVKQERLSLRDCELGNGCREAERGGLLNHSLLTSALASGVVSKKGMTSTA